MKTRLLNCHWIAMSIVTVSVIAHADAPSNGVIAAQESLKRTRLELQDQGFKTDLTNFDFSVSSESRAREAILEATAPERQVGPFQDYPNLMEPAESNQAIVVWQHAYLRRQTPAWPDASYELTWDDFGDVIMTKRERRSMSCWCACA